MNKMLNDNTKLWILIFTILLIGGSFFAIFAWAFIKLKWWFPLIFVMVFVLFAVTDWVGKRGGRLAVIIEKVLSAPLVVLVCLIGIVQPFITIVGTYLFVSIYAFGLPTLLLYGVSKLGWLEITPETIVFTVLALGSILCSTCYSVTKWIVHQTPLRDWGEHKYELYREDLAVYLIHPKNVIFVLYFVYFLFLGVAGFIQFQKGSFMISESLDAACLKAFLVFIAYTNMRSKAKETDVDVKNLLGRMLSLFVLEDKSK